jgi:HlyD family secretion protein
VVTYDAVIDVDNPDLKLKPGMTANVTFIYAEKDDVLKVPNAALRFKPPPGMLGAGGATGASGASGATGASGASGATGASGPSAAGSGARTGGGAGGAGGRPATKGPEPLDRRTIWVLKEGQVSPVRIRTGISDGSFSEVLEGEVAAGAEVVTDAAGPPSGFAAAMRRPF